MAGSPEGSQSRDSVYLAIGWVTRPHGTGGEVRVEPLSDVPARFSDLRRVFLSPEGKNPAAGGRPVNVAGVRWDRDALLVRFEGVDTPEEARKLQGWYLKVPATEAAPLPEGHFYIYQLIGLEVVDTHGNPVGRLKDVLRRPANDVFVVERADGRELLVPAIREAVADVSPGDGRVVIRPMEEETVEGGDA